MTETIDDVAIERRGRVLVLTLDRPKALNALSLPMIRRLDPVLEAAETDPDIAAVVIRGAGERAFCAGGDVRAVAIAAADPNDPLSADFFRAEYRLNRRIARFPKPYIALINGISMGGGVGLSVHGAFRVVTETLMFAMPETGIGLFPDVGAAHFLTRCPGQIGRYLGLLGARLGAADARHIGYATHVVKAADLDAVIDKLAAAGDVTKASVEAVLAGFAHDPGPAPLAEQRARIDACFAGADVDAVVAALEADGSDWAQDVLKQLSHKSPTSLRLTDEQLRRSGGLDVEACLVMDFRLSQRCMAGHDFREGIRALLIDKDNQPKWQPPTLAGVTSAMIDAYFQPLGAADLTF